jgi:hypothetical protein
VSIRQAPAATARSGTQRACQSSGPGLVGSTQDADRASRVRSPREPPLTPTSSVDTSGAPAAPVDGTDRASHIFATEGKGIMTDLPLRRSSAEPC